MSTVSTQNAPSGGAAAPTRSERLDRLPFAPAHRRLLVGSGIGWALDAMDVGLVGFVMAAVAKQWHLDAGTTGMVASVGFVGMAVGASAGGLLADRVGRRKVFALTLLVYGLATGASALAGSVAALLALRFVVGLGLGAELPVASTLVSEFAPARLRGRMVVALESFWAVGWIAAAVIGWLVVPRGADGWRWALAIGVVPTLYAAVVRATLPESVRFLEAAGRHDEAERAVRSFEASAGVAAPVQDAAPAHGPVVEATGERPSLWSAGLRRRTAALWGVWFFLNLAYYGAFTWIPSLLVAQGYTMTRSFGTTLVMTLAQLPGYAAAAWLVEAWGRRQTLAAFLAGSAVAALLFAQSSSHATVLASGSLLSFFALGAWGAVYAIGPEVYPTSVRGAGTGAAAAFGRLASIAAPLLVPWLLHRGGLVACFTTFCAAFGLAAVAALFLPERRGTTMAES